MMKKNDIRKHYKMLRNSLSENTVLKATAQINQQLPQIPISNAAMLMSYKAMPKFNEFNPLEMEKIFLNKFQNLKVCYPLINKEGMIAVAPNNSSRWVLSPFGTEELEDGTLISPETIGVVITPLLAFDLKDINNKKFHDIFLSERLQ